MVRRVLPLLFSIIIVFWGGCTDDDEVANPVISDQPVVSITFPQNNSRVPDLIEITAEASDDKGIARVDFFVDGRNLEIDFTPPYSALWSTYDCEDGSNHIIYAVAYDTDGNSNGSATVLCIKDTSLSIPETPVLYEATNVSDSGAVLTWSKNTENDFLKYTLYFDTSSTENPSMFELGINNRNDTTIEIHILNDTTLYRFRVVVEDIYGFKSWSNIIATTTINAPPKKPEFTLLRRFTEYVGINWKQSPIYDFSEYILIRSLDSLFDDADDTLVIISDQAQISYRDSTAVSDQDYYYFIQVLDIYDLASCSDFIYVSTFIPNYALDFSGTQYVTIPYYEDLYLGDNYTLEAWVYPRAQIDYARVIDKGPGSSVDPFFQYSLICDPMINSDFCNGTSFIRTNSGWATGSNVWNHIAISYNNGAMTFYIGGDSVKYVVYSVSSSCQFETPLTLGRRRLFDEFYFNGLIDEVRIWDVTRTSDEIHDWYNKHLMGNESGLVGYWDFDEGEGNTILSPTGNSGYLGETVDVEGSDPTWSENSCPITY